MTDPKSPSEPPMLQTQNNTSSVMCDTWIPSAASSGKCRKDTSIFGRLIMPILLLDRPFLQVL